jgi:hypothetical protein
MVALIAGLIALGLGITFLVICFRDFWIVFKGTVPSLFILGGLLAAYLGIEEIKDKQLAAKEGTWDSGAAGAEAQGAAADAEVDKYKAEVEELKAKLADLEKQNPPQNTE